MADVVQYSVVNGLPDIPDRTLHISWRYDLMGPGRVLVGGQNPDLPPGHLLFMDVHRLKVTEEGMWSMPKMETQKPNRTTGTPEIEWTRYGAA